MKNKNNEFRVFKNHKAFNSLLTKVKNSKDEMIVWRFFGEEKISARVAVKFYKKNLSEFWVKSDESEVDLLEEVVSGAINLNFFLPNQGVLFQGKIKGYDQNKNLIMEVPAKYVQIDRRKSVRAFIASNDNIKLALETDSKIHSQKKINKDIFDISNGGLSILCSKFEVALFENNFQNRYVNLVFKDQTIEAEIKYLYSYEIDPKEDESILYKCTKASFEFINPSNALKEKINTYIFKTFKNTDLFLY